MAKNMLMPVKLIIPLDAPAISITHMAGMSHISIFQSRLLMKAGL